MKQDMIVILDLGSTENTVLAREIRELGVYSEIHPHDITEEEIKALDNVKGIILNGGENRVVDGKEVEVRPELYTWGYPVISVDYPASRCDVRFDSLPDQETLKKFVFDECKAEANWNMKNFIEDQVELICRQVGDRKVLLALSGGVDSSVVAAMLIKAIGQQLVCVHVNHGLMRKNESESVVEVFRNQLHANLIYVDATERFLGKLEKELLHGRIGQVSQDGEVKGHGVGPFVEGHEFHILHIEAIITYHAEDAAHGVGLVRTGQTNLDAPAAGSRVNAGRKFLEKIRIPIKEQAILKHAACFHDFPHHGKVFRQTVSWNIRPQTVQDGLFPVPPIDCGLPCRLLCLGHFQRAVHTAQDECLDLGIKGIDFFSHIF